MEVEKGGEALNMLKTTPMEWFTWSSAELYGLHADRLTVDAYCCSGG